MANNIGSIPTGIEINGVEKECTVASDTPINIGDFVNYIEDYAEVMNITKKQSLMTVASSSAYIYILELTDNKFIISLYNGSDSDVKLYGCYIDSDNNITIGSAYNPYNSTYTFSRNSIRRINDDYFIAEYSKSLDESSTSSGYGDYTECARVFKCDSNLNITAGSISIIANDGTTFNSQCQIRGFSVYENGIYPIARIDCCIEGDTHSEGSASGLYEIIMSVNTTSMTVSKYSQSKIDSTIIADKASGGFYIKSKNLAIILHGTRSYVKGPESCICRIYSGYTLKSTYTLINYSYEDGLTSPRVEYDNTNEIIHVLRYPSSNEASSFGISTKQYNIYQLYRCDSNGNISQASSYSAILGSTYVTPYYPKWIMHTSNINKWYILYSVGMGRGNIIMSKVTYDGNNIELENNIDSGFKPGDFCIFSTHPVFIQTKYGSTEMASYDVFEKVYTKTATPYSSSSDNLIGVAKTGGNKNESITIYAPNS